MKDMSEYRPDPNTMYVIGMSIIGVIFALFADNFKDIQTQIYILLIFMFILGIIEATNKREKIGEHWGKLAVIK